MRRLEVTALTIAVGSPCVDFHLPSTTGTASLNALRGRPFLLSFFTMAFTPT